MLTHLLLAASAATSDPSAHWFFRTYPEFQGLNPSHLVFLLVPFWITVFFVSRFAVRPLMHVLEEREAKTEGARAEAADFEAKFNEKLKAYEARLAETRQKASDERARIRQSAAVEVEKILGAARDEATKAVDDVRAGIDAERGKAREELKKSAEALAAELASKALGRDVKGTAPARGGAPARSEARS